MSKFVCCAGCPIALLEEGSGVIGGGEGMPRTANPTNTGGVVSGGRRNQGIGVFYSRVKEALGEAFHELLDGGESEIYVEVHVSDIEGGSRDLSEETVLEGLHFMQVMRLGVCEDYASICHYGTDNRGIPISNLQLSDNLLRADSKEWSLPRTKAARESAVLMCSLKDSR